MKKKFLVLALTAFMCSHSYAQDSNTKEIDDKYVENDVVSLAGKKGFSFSTKAGDFLFKPYALVQTSLSFNRYDDQGLESLYARNWANSGFAIPNAILGFTGKAFGKVTFNLSLNAAKVVLPYCNKPGLMQPSKNHSVFVSESLKPRSCMLT